MPAFTAHSEPVPVFDPEWGYRFSFVIVHRVRITRFMTVAAELDPDRYVEEQEKGGGESPRT